MKSSEAAQQSSPRDWGGRSGIGDAGVSQEVPPDPSGQQVKETAIISRSEGSGKKKQPQMIADSLTIAMRNAPLEAVQHHAMLRGLPVHGSRTQLINRIVKNIRQSRQSSSSSVGNI